MKHDPIIRVRNLQLFAEGGAQGTGVTAPDAGVQTGVTAPDAGVQQQEPDRNATFEKLIKGEYKDLYDARVQDTLQKRLKGQNETVERYKALATGLEILAKKYGVDPTDSKALSKAIEADDSLFSTEALESGTSMEELRRIRNMEMELNALRRQEEDRSRKDHAKKQYEQWMRQAEEAKTIYPQLDLETEVKNPQFMRLLNAGVDVGAAYLVLHKDEVIPAAMQHVAKSVEDKLAGKIAANGARPAENGTNPQSGPVVKSDVSTMTKADRAEINRRVMRGEKISFG